MQFLRGVALGLISVFLFFVLFLLGFAFTLNNTVLNPKFTADQVSHLDIPANVRYFMAQQLHEGESVYLAAIDKTLSEMEPWTEEHLDRAVYAGYDYLLGKTDSFYLAIPTEPLKQNFAKNLTLAYEQSPPPEYDGLSSTQKAVYLSQIEQQIDSLIPAVLEIDRNFIGDDAAQTLEQAKSIVSYIRTGYFVLIAVSLVLIFLAIFIVKEVKTVASSLGIILLSSGVISLAVSLLFKKYIPGLVPAGDLPPQMQLWLSQFISNVLSPWSIFSIIILAAGIILLVFTFLYCKHRGNTKPDMVRKQGLI